MVLECLDSEERSGGKNELVQEIHVIGVVWWVVENLDNFDFVLH